MISNCAGRFNDPLSIDGMLDALSSLPIVHQVQFRKDRNAAREDDIKNSRGFLILNPDIDTFGLDVEGLVINRAGEEHEGKEYRVVFDPAMKGMKDKETGGICAGFWLEAMKPFNFLDFYINADFKIEHDQEGQD